VKKVDSDALGVLNQALGLTGAGSPITELTDGIVDQTLDVVPVVRRGRTQARTDGLYTAVFRNVHSGASSLSSEINPYEVTPAIAIAPYPTPMPRQFDIWLLSATLRRATGTGTLAAALYIRYSAIQQGWGIDDGNAAVALLSIVPFAFWSTVFNTGGTVIGTDGLGGQLNSVQGMRLPRDPNLALVFESMSSAASNFTCDLVLGVFPVSLGQDGRV